MSSALTDQLSLGEEIPPHPVKPFLKWAGGKQQLLSELHRRKPARFARYFEPFLGGGALFFALRPNMATLSDVNTELITCYEAVRSDVEAVIAELGKHRNALDHFLEVRAQNPDSLSRAQRAARLIFLNRTCYNGLYRVNRRGEFNTPFGRYSNPTICNSAALRAASVALRNAVLHAQDYREVLIKARRGDFVYFDPPYLPLSQYSDFKRYSQVPFGEVQHEELRLVFDELTSRGCFVMLSNSTAARAHTLYEDYFVHLVPAKRLINKNATRRSPVIEMIVTNYDDQDQIG